MGIALGGIPLAISEAAIEQWCSPTGYLPFVRDFIHAPTIARAPLRNDPLGARKFPVIAGPNYPPPPNLRFNELYWPTGASRWAEGYFLTTGEFAGRIAAQIASGGTAYLPVPLTMNDGQTGITVQMYALPPRPLASQTLPNPPFVIPLVDERYFWQASIGGMSEAAITWESLISGLKPSSSFTTEYSTISATYHIPEPACFTRRSAAAVLIDAACHSVGLRYVRKFSMKYKAENWEDAEKVYNANRNLRGEIVAGDDFSGVLPQSVIPSQIDVYFPSLNVDCDMEKKSYTPTNRGKNGFIKTFTTFAPFVSANESECVALANKIGEDYVASLKFRYDVCFAGIHPYEPCAYDDGIIFSFAWCGGQPHESQLYRATTRVWSPPVNFGTDELYHAFADYPTFMGEDHLTVELDEELVFEGQATASVLDGPPGELSDTGKNVEVFDELLLTGQTIASGTRVHLTRKCGYWAVTNASCAT